MTVNKTGHTSNRGRGRTTHNLGTVAVPAVAQWHACSRAGRAPATRQPRAGHAPAGRGVARGRGTVDQSNQCVACKTRQKFILEIGMRGGARPETGAGLGYFSDDIESLPIIHALIPPIRWLLVC